MRVPRSGVTFAESFEWALAARWWGFRRLTDFRELDGEEQSELIAVYRASAQMEAAVAQERAKEAERAARRGGRKRR